MTDVSRETLCSGCGKCNNRQPQRYCRECHAHYMRVNRPKHSELSQLQRFKANCRSYLNVYLKRGVIQRQSCEVCGSKKSEAHHNDYTKPLQVIWLCRLHHLAHHGIIQV